MVRADLGSKLPDDYLAQLRAANLRPLWTAPVQGAMQVQGQPLRRAIPAMWFYAKAREYLLRAGELVSLEEAERRVLIMINPGYVSPEALSASSSIYAALQLVLPGECAPSHRHSAAACRFIVEGSQAYTAVNGEKFLMSPGDLILTPSHHWHEHVHEGTKPVIWLDILDLPLSASFDAMYIVTGSRTPATALKAPSQAYKVAGLVPFRSPLTPPRRYPMMHYRWSEVRAALHEMASVTAQSEPLHMMYVNPDSGADVLEPYRFSIRMLRPGEEIVPVLASASAVFHVVEGDGQSEIGGQTFDWSQGDVMAAPTLTPIRHRNRSSTKAAFLLQVDDSPLQYKMGWYEERP